MKTVSDTQIRSSLRSTVARYRLDMQRMIVRITRGTMRVSGQLLLLGRPSERVPLAVVEAFERDLARAPGVQLLYFDFDNWRRLGTGEWVPVERARRAAVLCADADADDELAEVAVEASRAEEPARRSSLDELLAALAV